MDTHGLEIWLEFICPIHHIYIYTHVYTSVKTQEFICPIPHTSVKTQEAVDQEKHGTTATRFGHTAAERDAFCRLIMYITAV